MRNVFFRWEMIAAIGLSAAISGGAPSVWPTSSSLTPLPAWQVILGSRSAPHLSGPEGLAIDRRGTGVRKWLYLADSGKNRIVKLGTGGRFLATWGGSGTGPGQFLRPLGVAVDGHGDVYVADTGNNRVQKFGPDGRFLAAWGATGSGPGQFDAPSGLAVGGSGNVFVADRNNERIEKFSPSGQLLGVWPVLIPGRPCTGTLCNPSGLGTPGPYALTVDRAGNVYAAVDTGQCSGGHCVMDYIALETFAPSGTIRRTVIGGNPYGRFAYAPVPGVTSVNGPWWQIGGLAGDAAGHLFLTNWGPSVLEISAAGKLLQQWQQPPSRSGSPSGGISVDGHGNPIVAATADNSVIRLLLH